MNINQINDDDILDYLMNSEFNEGLNPDEFKFLLLRFRYHYRLLKSKLERSEIMNETKIKELVEKIDCFEILIVQAVRNKEKAEREIQKLKERKLTWWERFFGKIRNLENEN